MRIQRVKIFLAVQIGNIIIEMKRGLNFQKTSPYDELPPLGIQFGQRSIREMICIDTLSRINVRSGVTGINHRQFNSIDREVSIYRCFVINCNIKLYLPLNC